MGIVGDASEAARLSPSDRRMLVCMRLCTFRSNMHLKPDCSLAVAGCVVGLSGMPERLGAARDAIGAERRGAPQRYPRGIAPRCPWSSLSAMVRRQRSGAVVASLREGRLLGRGRSVTPDRGGKFERGA